MKKIYSLLAGLTLLFFAGNIQAQAPSCSVNTSPANTTTNVNPEPYITLKWAPVSGATSYDIYLSSKVPPTNLIATVTSDTFNFTGASYNTIYYWYIVPKNVDGSAAGCSTTTSTFSTSAPPPPPSNDDCNTATTVTNSPISGTTFNATQSQPADACGVYTGTANDDVWYHFSTLSSGPVTITMVGDGTFDGVLEAFAGTCGSLTELVCSDVTQQGGTETVTLNAVAGTNYKVRVYGFGSDADANDRGTFTISATGAPLPISLLEFKGDHSTHKNVITWTTTSEQNNSGFELQYSTDGVSFDNLSFISSKAVNGNSTNALTYAFTDTRLLSGAAYYRLRQIDKDGKSNYSNVISLKGEKVNAITLSNLYPNPAKNKLNVMIAAPSNDKVNIQISDLAGQILLQQATTVLNGDNKISVDVTTLPAGSYFIRAKGNNGLQTAVSKFVKE